MCPLLIAPLFKDETDTPNRQMETIGNRQVAAKRDEDAAYTLGHADS